MRRISPGPAREPVEQRAQSRSKPPIATVATLTALTGFGVDFYAKTHGVTGGNRVAMSAGATLVAGAALESLWLREHVAPEHRGLVDAAAIGAATIGVAAVAIGSNRGLFGPARRSVAELAAARDQLVAHPAQGAAADQVRGDLLPLIDRALAGRRAAIDHVDHAITGRANAALTMLDALDAAARPAAAATDTPIAAAAADDAAAIRW